MKINGVEIVDTFAEAFPVYLSRILLTANNKGWTLIAAQSATGFGTSLVTCPAQAGIEGPKPHETPDGRPGVIIQIGAKTKSRLDTQLLLRLGGCVMTCPTTSIFDAMSQQEKRGLLETGRKIGFFGDGYQKRAKIHGIDVIRIPRMEGDFIIERQFGYTVGVADDFCIMADCQESALFAAEAAIASIKNVRGVVTIFPGGICASGSKVGSLKYNFLKASTSHRYCPTIAHKVEDTKVPRNVKSVYEIVIMGLNSSRVKHAMRVGIESATKIRGVIKIDAWNEGGKFGSYKFYLREILKRE